jgi:predicted dehydrogenase
MAGPPIRLGIVGFGRLARAYYLPALRARDDVELAAVADPLAASQAAAAALGGVRVHADHGTLLERERLDAVLVASPPSSHLAVLDDAAAAGLAVFLEKPFVLSHQLAVLEARPPMPRVMLDLNRRFWPPYRRIAELARGELGRPIEADFALHTDLLAWSTVTTHRLVTDEGGLLHDLGSQAIDLACMLGGREPRAIVAETGSRRWPDDTLRLRITFPDGSVVRCDLAYDGRTYERLSVRGPSGSAHLSDPNMAIARETDGWLRARSRDVAAFAYHMFRREQSFARASIAAAIAAFVRAVRTGEGYSPGFDDGLRNARWVAAAASSARMGAAA